MIKLKVKAEILDEHGGEAGVRISNETSGNGREVLHESIAAVRSITSSLRKASPFLLMAFLDAVRNDHTILLGEEVDEDEAPKKSAESFLADLMSEGIVERGMN